MEPSSNDEDIITVDMLSKKEEGSDTPVVGTETTTSLFLSFRMTRVEFEALLCILAPHLHELLTHSGTRWKTQRNLSPIVQVTIFPCVISHQTRGI